MSRYALAALLLALPPRGAAPQASVPPLAWSQYRLDNGLDVVLAPDDAATEVSVEWWVHVGARHEAPGRFGLAHFFEHAMPFGQGLIRTASGRRLLDSMRTNGNALTRFDYTRYYVQGRPEALDLFVLAAADRLRADPRRELTDERVAAHRRNVTAEIARQASGTWGWPVKHALHVGTFGPQHPYGHHMYGSDAETAATSPDDMLRWFRAHLRPEYATLIVVGRFDTAAARAAIDRSFGAIPGGTRPSRAAPVPVTTVAGADTVTIASDEGHVMLSWAVPHWASPERVALDLLAQVLTERLAASRPAAVRTAEAETEFWELAGRFGMQATVESGSRAVEARAERWMRAALERLIAGGVTADELSRARAARTAAIRDHMAVIGWQGSRTELLGEGAILAGDPGAYVRQLERQGSVTPDLVQRTAAQWLASPGFVLVVRGRGASSR
jgi:predicted Zn-dependent peptidase